MTKHLVSKELKDDNTNSEVVISLIWVPRIIAGINNYKIHKAKMHYVIYCVDKCISALVFFFIYVPIGM